MSSRDMLKETAGVIGSLFENADRILWSVVWFVLAIAFTSFAAGVAVAWFFQKGAS